MSYPTTVTFTINGEELVVEFPDGQSAQAASELVVGTAYLGGIDAEACSVTSLGENQSGQPVTSVSEVGTDDAFEFVSEQNVARRAAGEPATVTFTLRDWCSEGDYLIGADG